MFSVMITILSIVLVMAGLGGLVYLLDPWVGPHEDWLYLVVLNTAPLLVPLLFVAVLFRRLWATAVIVAFGAGLLFVINDIKLAELGQPVLFTDLFLLTQVVGNASMLSLYAQPIFLGAASLGALVLVALACWLEPPRFGWLGSLLFLTAASLLALGMVTSPANQVFAQRGAMNTPWSPIESVQDTGLVASLAAAAGKDLIGIPEADPGVVAETLKRLSPSVQPAPNILMPSQRPDIVVILSESFFDPDILSDVDPCAYLPEWCALKQSGFAGKMSVPTYGGNTTRTEFEVLTGVPYSLLPAGVYPYTSVVRKPMASLPHWLQLMGYQATAVHPHKRTFWQRQRAYPLLGFQQFIAEEDMRGYQRKGWFISDRDMTDRIIGLFEEDTEHPQLVFAISMENHGPWNKPRPNIDQNRLMTIPTPQKIQGEDSLVWRQYIYHAQNAISELNRVKDFLDRRDRPYLLVFFGDHLPGLSRVYDRLGFENGLSVMHQKTPFLILSQDFHEGSGWPVESAFQLPMKLLELSGLPKPKRYGALTRAYDSAEGVLPEGAEAALQLSLLQESLSDWATQAAEFKDEFGG
jgi:phosphoglycerol transferase MdoB-like AlkP superfamily enzyme